MKIIINETERTIDTEYIEKAMTLEQFETLLWMAIEAERTKANAAGMKAEEASTAEYNAQLISEIKKADSTDTMETVRQRVDNAIREKTKPLGEK